MSRFLLPLFVLRMPLGTAPYACVDVREFFIVDDFHVRAKSDFTSIKEGDKVSIELDETVFDESEDSFSNEGEEQDENEANGEHDMPRSVGDGTNARSILPLSIRPALLLFPLPLLFV